MCYVYSDIIYLRNLGHTIFTACRKPNVVEICRTVPKLTSQNEYTDMAFPSCLHCRKNKIRSQLIHEREWLLSVYSHTVSQLVKKFPALSEQDGSLPSLPADHIPRHRKLISILISLFTKLYFNTMFLIRLTLESVIFRIDITHRYWCIFTSGARSVSFPPHH